MSEVLSQIPRFTSVASLHGPATGMLYEGQLVQPPPKVERDYCVLGDDVDVVFDCRSLVGRRNGPVSDDIVLSLLNAQPKSTGYVPLMVLSRQTSLVPQSAWLKNATQQAKGMLDLQPDWNGHGAPTPSEVSVKIVQRALTELSKVRLPVPRVAPSVEGGVGIAFEHGSQYVLVECYNDGEIVVGTSSKDAGQDAWQIDAANPLGLAMAARRIANFLRT